MFIRAEALRLDPEVEKLDEPDRFEELDEPDWFAELDELLVPARSAAREASCAKRLLSYPANASVPAAIAAAVRRVKRFCIGVPFR